MTSYGRFEPYPFLFTGRITVPLRILFVRHGESHANLDQVFANRVTIPGDLTPEGISQALILANEVMPWGVTHIYTSPLPRAQQTAGILAEALGAPVTVTDALREYDVGDFEGLPYSGNNAWRWARYEMIEQSWRAGDHAARHPGGESLADLTRRVLPFISGVVTQHDNSETLVAVGHGALFRAVLPLLLANIPPGYAWHHPIRHGDIIVAAHLHHGWTCERWAHDGFPIPD
jgi:probable phosphoglycerate mutase